MRSISLHHSSLRRNRFVVRNLVQFYSNSSEWGFHVGKFVGYARNNYRSLQ